jgi:alpha-N-arabinofuranosidase
MILTPTYHIFDMYKVHQDAKYLNIALNSPNYDVDGKSLKAVNVSASQDADGKIHLSLVNIDLHKTVTISTELKGLQWQTVTGQILTSANITDVNTFNQPLKITLHKFTGAKQENGKLVVTLPAKSVVTLELN